MITKNIFGLLFSMFLLQSAQAQTALQFFLVSDYQEGVGRFAVHSCDDGSLLLARDRNICASGFCQKTAPSYTRIPSIRENHNPQRGYSTVLVSNKNEMIEMVLESNGTKYFYYSSDELKIENKKIPLTLATTVGEENPRALCSKEIALEK